jgi:hypothetical protein
MASALGIMEMGAPKSTDLKIGVINPTVIPQVGPQIKPQSITAKCIGQSAAPIVGISIVRKGSSKPSARNIEEYKSRARATFLPFAIIITYIKKSVIQYTILFFYFQDLLDKKDSPF